MINDSTNFTTKRRITSHLKSLNIKKTKIHDVRNPDPGLGQAHQYGVAKPVNVYPNFSLYTAYDDPFAIFKFFLQILYSIWILYHCLHSIVS